MLRSNQTGIVPVCIRGCITTSTVVQFVVKPNPGSDPTKVIELAKESAVLWRKYGGEVSYWSVVAGEIGSSFSWFDSKPFLAMARQWTVWALMLILDHGRSDVPRLA